MHHRIRTPQRERNDPCREGCLCPVCTGLDCLERPRYAPGLLLTDKELNSHLDYTIAKNKLHNRYLWGSGIVCGLEVTCHECESTHVSVHPGYAIDPCGNDIVVCEEHHFDVIAAINACRREERPDCEPWRESRRVDCRDAEQEWCITIRYAEKEGRPTTALVSKTTGQCGCGRGSACSCGKNGNGSSRAATQVQQVTQVGRCEPTRVLERYELGVLCLPQEDNGEQEGVAAILDALQKLGLRLPLECVAQCVQDFQRFAAQAQQIIDLLDDFSARNQIFRLLCRLLEDVREYLLDADLTNCDLARQLGLIACPPPPQNDDGWPQFQILVRQALIAVAQILINALQNCLCLELLPKCPGDVCEDRLILACVTVRDGRVVNICHSKRRYVLTVQNLLSALVSVIFANWCCEPFRFIRGETGVSDTVFDPAFGTQLSSQPIAVAANVARMFMANRAFEGVPEESAVDPSAFTGRPVSAVREELGDQIVAVDTVDWSPAETVLRNMEAPRLRRDEPLRLYVDDRERVVAIGRYAEAERMRLELAQANDRINALEKQVSELINRAGGIDNGG